LRRHHFLRFALLLALLHLPLTAATAPAATPVKIEVLYMNHGPMQPTLKSLRELFARHGDAVQVAWHDFESADGVNFMRSKNIRSHIPLAIWLNNNDSAMLEGREIRFSGFPSGAGPAAFQGRWGVDELGRVLGQLAGTTAATP
jgi:hypothetical protein